MPDGQQLLDADAAEQQVCQIKACVGGVCQHAPLWEEIVRGVWLHTCAPLPFASRCVLLQACKQSMTFAFGCSWDQAAAVAVDNGALLACTASCPPPAGPIHPNDFMLAFEACREACGCIAGFTRASLCKVLA
jgi:hypothetical protein